jgi:hypothetical protein
LDELKLGPPEDVYDVVPEKLTLELADADLLTKDDTDELCDTLGEPDALPEIVTDGVSLYDNVVSGETDGLPEAELLLVNVFVTVTVFVIPVGKVVGLVVKVLIAEFVTVLVILRLVRGV